MYFKILIPYLLVFCFVAAVSLPMLFQQGESRDFIITFILMLIIITVVPFTILYLKDRLLKKQGLTQKEITTKGVMYFTTPFMFLVTFLFGWAGWLVVGKSGYYWQLLLGLVIGAIIGLSSIYLTSVKKRGEGYYKRQRNLAKTSVGMFILVSSILSISFFPNKVPGGDWIFKNYPDIFAILMGTAISMVFFSTLGGLLMAIRRKEHIEVDA